MFLDAAKIQESNSTAVARNAEDRHRQSLATISRAESYTTKSDEADAARDMSTI